ncbi:MAG TPA: rhodanese-like domain-containing protein [Bacilli bacterium]|nr:rhodanese-like domain-containing protein [Bacilli bacterium]
MAKEIDGINQIDAAELKQLIDEKKNVTLIDVREPQEYEAGHIPGIPLIPMHQIPANLDKLDKDTEYVFVCRSGNRSQQVAHFLKAKGFDKVSNFYGGMLSWSYEIKPGMDK